MPAEFQLSLAAVDILGEHLGVDIRQFPFEIPSVGHLLEDRARIAESVWADLTRRRLVHNGRLTGEVEQSVRMLAEFEIAVVVFGEIDGEPILSRLATAGRFGVHAQKLDQVLWLREIRPESLARQAIGLIGDRHAGPGQSITVRHEEPKRVEDDNSARTFSKPVRGSGDRERRALRHLFDTPLLGSGGFLVLARDRLGRETAAPPLSWLDTESGCYLVQHQPATDATPATETTSPADSARLCQQLDKLITAVQPSGPGR
ncbi:ESAT-6 protein secretion system EspG family protein [Herbihabitans rhizosphaerae]|uniref:ESAT-6 protein secretion system EspG family protein n=1 Tax=Herbihabitans rhizosphaerae TaxID=1872711 RepID=A0A4Q7KIH1_9PSEU|nr:ESX secretion-associated protein EspG [Herbihabitans rhizosphaerae]RZS32698.1 ESAT-6 protein secretion system EspG family protein [Herbihabitans rhizosphaerae]